MLRPVDGGQSWVVGKLGSTGESAGVQARPLLRPPWQTTGPPQVPPLGQSALLLHGPAAFEPPVQVWLQTGHDWMPSAVGKRSPVRKSSELSGRLRFDAPVTQSAVPLAFCDTVLMTHKLIGVVVEVVGVVGGGRGVVGVGVVGVVVAIVVVVVVAGAVVVVPGAVVVVTGAVVVVTGAVVVVTGAVVVVTGAVVVVTGAVVVVT